MRRQHGSSAGFWLALVLLGLAAIPLILARRAAPLKPLSTSDAAVWTVPGEIVVQLRDGEGAGIAGALSGAYGLSFVESGPGSMHGDILTASAPAVAIPALLARLRTDSRVRYAEPQHLLRELWKPNDPRYSEQWNFRQIHTEKAWDVTKGEGAVVAVIDTGVAFEKDAKCYQARDFGDTKFTSPYDFISRDKHPTDDNGHGTHVAGTIAESTNNGEGVAGIAFEAKVMPLKVLTKDGFGRMSDIAAAIRYAADHGANVINMSLGGPFPDSITRSACQYAVGKGVTIVCAAGNGGREGVGYPAAYPECIAVSALGPTGELAPYSSWGQQVAISAPGGDKTQGEDKGILQNTYLRRYSSDSAADSLDSFSALNRDAVGSAPGGQRDSYEDGYFYFQGTSMASPHVAGVAALVVSRGVKDPAEVRAVLQKSAQARGAKEKYGAGEVDAAAAVRVADAENNAYRGRLLLTAALLLGALGLGVTGRRGAWGSALALAVGLFLPDMVSALAGFDSIWNLVGHSVLVPAYLLAWEAESSAERRFCGFLAAGIAAHLLWDLCSGLGPALSPVAGAALPWLWSNVVVGVGALVTSSRR